MRQSLEFGASIVESIAELQRGAEFRNRDMVARQESRLRDLVLFGQSVSVRDVKPEALSAFLALRGVAAEAAADARSTLESWPSGCAGSRFDVLMKRASETFASVEAAFADTVPAHPLERRAGQPDDGKVLRRVIV